MANDEWSERLSEYVDDELGADERRALEAHLAGCPSCAQAVDEIRQVAARAARLPSSPPDADLWHGIAARIESAPQQRPLFRALAAAAARRFTFTLPQLAAAGVALVLVSGWLAARLTAPPVVTDPRAGGVQSSSPAAGRDTGNGGYQAGVITASFADAEYDAAVADLERALREGRGRLDPDTVTVVEDNLALIDRAIGEAREALDADPANLYVSQHLMQTRRAKLDLLRQVAALTAEFN
jgi:hypothetical protein